MTLPETTGTGTAGASVEAIRQMLSNVGAFQTLVGAATADDALLRIHVEGIDKTPAPQLPFALITPACEPGAWEINVIGTGEANDYAESGFAHLLFEMEAPEAYADNEADLALFTLDACGIVKSMCETSLAEGALMIRRATLEGRRETTLEERDTVGHRVAIQFRIEWGMTL